MKVQENPKCLTTGSQGLCLLYINYLLHMTLLFIQMSYEGFSNDPGIFQNTIWKEPGRVLSQLHIFNLGTYSLSLFHPILLSLPLACLSTAYPVAPLYFFKSVLIRLLRLECSQKMHLLDLISLMEAICLYSSNYCE